ncbi:MAG: nucleotidyl transferase AbiEii/AbiGii toxin family protein [Pseudorhodobacter sp.]|nr:nucleotidyl transferase AbiEii/AbiGii toxin family protein [Frankiaceae bacterium]
MSRPSRGDAGGRAYLDLQNLARRQGRSTQSLLVLYVLERFLARLSTHRDRDRFVLKGGMLLAAWDARRATMDGDLLASGVSIDAEQILRAVADIAATPPQVEDGVQFLTDTAVATSIRDGDLYGGIRVTMRALLSTAEVKVQLDVSTGDPVTPGPQPITYPALRAVHQPVPLLGYPLPVVLAEKLCTAVDLGAANTRVRDYFDIATLTGRHDVAADDLLAALTATAAHRGVRLRPLTEVIGDLPATRSVTYTAFLRRLGPDAADAPARFQDVVDLVTAFADPALEGSLGDDARWNASYRTWHGPA